MVKTAVQKLTAVPEALRASIAQTKAGYRQLGGSGLRVSNPILGGMHVGSSEWLPWVLDEPKVRDGLSFAQFQSELTPTPQALMLLKAAYDRGINTVRPTSPHGVYLHGNS